jgi:SAM-dependent methyltransferase
MGKLIMNPEYDGLADIYDIWCEGDPSAAPCLDFYVERMCQQPGTRVELGVGTGRIAIPVLQRGGSLIGVDVSPRMLTTCRDKADRAGVGPALHLVQQDVRTLRLSTSADLITFPFRSFGHLLDDADKLACLRSVYANLVPGGRFLFDHYIWDEVWARNHDGVARLMAEQDFGAFRLRIWDLYQYSYAARRMDCRVRIQRLAAGSGEVLDERVERFEFSWIELSQVCQLIAESGFEVEALHGSFRPEYTFDPSSTEQVWILRRPVNS